MKSQSKNAIVSAFVTAITARDSTGSLVTQVCNIADKHGGSQLTKDDQDAVISEIAKARKWGENVIRARSSEVRTILNTCAVLPEAIASLSKKAGTCDWHAGLKLGRRLKKGDSVTEAVAYVIANASTEPKASHPAGRVAAGLKAWHKQSKTDKRLVIEKATALLSTIGLKLSFE